MIGDFVDYSELGNGGYEFKKEDGSPFVAMGPEAKRLAQALDAQKQYAPQPTAMNGGREDPNARMSVPDVAAPVPGVSEAPQAPVVDLDQVDAQEAAAAPVPLYGTKGGGVMEKYPTTGQMYVRTPGSAGVSRQQLATKSTQGVALPSGAAQTVEGGFAPSDDYLNSMADANIDKKLALQRLDDAQSQRAQAEQQFNANRVAEQASGVEAERERQTKIAQGVDRDLLTLQQATSELKSSKVDPNRMFRGAGGTLRTIGMAIADAMGAFGAAINHTQNFAHGVIQASIERDIAEQEAELAQKGRNHNNALSAWIRSTGSLDQAKAGLRIQQLELAKSKADEIGSMNKSQEVQANHAMVTASLDEDLAKNMEAYRQASLGKHTQQVSAQYAYPHAGAAPGRRLATQEEVKGDVAIQGEKADLAHTQAGTAKTVADTEAKKGPGGQIPRGFIQAYGAADSILKTGENLLNAYGVKPGEKVDWNKGKFLETRANLVEQQRGREIDSQIGTFQAEAHKLVSGNGATDPDKKEFEEQRKHWSTAQKITFIQNTLAMAHHKQKFIESQRGHGDNASENQESGGAGGLEQFGGQEEQ
jgi:hypothetical protein